MFIRICKLLLISSLIDFNFTDSYNFRKPIYMSSFEREIVASPLAPPAIGY